MVFQGLITPQDTRIKIACKVKWRNGNQNKVLDCNDTQRNIYKVDTWRLEQLVTRNGSTMIVNNPTSFVKDIVKIQPLWSKDFGDKIQFGSIEPLSGKKIDYTLSDIQIWIEDSKQLGRFIKIYPV